MPGPFDVLPEQIQVLGARFTPFVNKLLEIEARAHGIAGHLVAVNANETTPDGGVDAAIRGSPGTDFVPPGASAWQFKRTNYGPKQCADELDGAKWAHEFLLDGGSYILIIGAVLPDDKVEERRTEVAKKALELGLIATDDRNRVRVYDANRVARWASRYPSLAVSRLAGGPGSSAMDFAQWAETRTHVTTWVADDARRQAIDSIRKQLISAGIVDVRVQGEAGVGKTRLVLEAVRTPDLSPLVAYVPDANAIAGEFLAHLVAENRTAVLVVDECPAERHIKLVERLPAHPAIKLVTIGDVGAAVARAPLVGVTPVSDDVTEEFLKRNYEQLPSESRRFVIDHSRGNTRWTMVLADRVTRTTSAQAAELIARNDIEMFVSTLLPEGRDFFCAALMALLEHVGWEGAVAYQVDLLCSFAGVSKEQMQSAADHLEQQGLLVHHGRFYAVSPHPLSVYLAAEAWRAHGDRLVSELLPQFDERMALSFFRRVADLGRFEPARSVLPQLLSRGGPFSSLEQLEANNLGKVLTQLAIVLPDEVALHLSELIHGASLDELRSRQASRRDLVWTLEKLAWHTRTFELAAGSLLRLALAENESYANNATATWTSLLSTFLPATAALPSTRVEYLRRVATSPDPATRLLVVEAAAGALEYHESVMVSGELQGGVLVEPRGTPRTYGDAGEYRREVIAILSELAGDSDSDVALRAEASLIGAVHPLIDDQFAGEALTDALLGLRGEGINRLRVEVEHLVALYDKHDPDDRPVRERLHHLLDRLPAPTAEEALAVVARLRPWDFPDGELRQRVLDSVRDLPDGEGRRDLVLGVLRGEEMPAAWEIGRAVSTVDGRDEAWIVGLVDAFATNPSGLLGYLSGLADAGEESAFDDFLDSATAQQLSSRDRLAIAVRGPVTDQSRSRILSSARELLPREGTSVLFGWHRNLDEDAVASLLPNWLQHLDSQEDYNALVEWVGVILHDEGYWPAVRDLVWELLSLRGHFPELRQKRWGWARLALRFVEDRALALAAMLFDLMESGVLMVIERGEEAALLARCARSSPTDVWADVAQRLVSGSWRLQMQLQGWFLESVPPAIVVAWIGDEVERARAAASITRVGEGEPTAVTRHLLEKFHEDADVRSALYGALVAGMWTGPESDRIKRQLDQLESWRRSASEPHGVRAWAREVSDALQENLRSALLREAEQEF